MSRIAFLFPGQGAQFVGMGKRLYESLPAARRLFDEAGKILGYDLAQLCFNGPAETLDSTIYSQPAIFVTSLAAVEALRAESPDVVLACEAAAGLSLGEYSALVFAGVMEFPEGLLIVQRRGAAMQQASEATPGGMISILGLELVEVERICEQASQGEILRVANLLCPGVTVISGTTAACERAADLAVKAGASRVVPVAVAGAFHTPIMKPADQKLAEAIATARLRRPRIPVISNVDARPHDDPEEIRELLIRQVIEPVRWEESMRYLLAAGFDQFYEVGPGRVLRGLMRRIDRNVACYGVEV
ncbi:MAG: ACP S-malonyltransferase [Thermoguttaceae bacterium]|nr:ACP S-malonyltransferase [Thermoguttaceae bacterium]MDW8077572.1 ACP S-malonyltransferase [Thermoguttaceae bacterium]